VLPEHHHDERGDQRTAGHIEAFLEGPIPPPRPPRAAGGKRRPLVLDTRQDWVTALRYEAARHARYGRPASVLLLGLSGIPPEPAVERIARTIGDVIRAEARETDRAVRTGRLDFRLLLPETGGRAAHSLAERLERAYRSAPDGRADGVSLTVEVATAPRNGRLEDAVAEAEVRFAGRSAPG
jgi:GGDEF domain-containing protein